MGMSKNVNIKDNKRINSHNIPVEYPETQELAGHVFHHLAGGLYKADEEFELTKAEARKILREYRNVRLVVRKKPGETDQYSDYANWAQMTSYCRLTVGRYDVYHVVYAYTFGYEYPELELLLREDYDWDKLLRSAGKRVHSEMAKLEDCHKDFDKMDILCHYVFSELYGETNNAKVQAALPKLRRAFEWNWPEAGIPGFLRLGDDVCEEIEDGIYKFVRYYSIKKHWEYTYAYIAEIPFPEGITADDIAYICECEMDGGGWYIPEESRAVCIAIGKEHFDRLREMNSHEFRYHPESETAKAKKRRG